MVVLNFLTCQEKIGSSVLYDMVVGILLDERLPQWFFCNCNMFFVVSFSKFLYSPCLAVCHDMKFWLELGLEECCCTKCIFHIYIYRHTYIYVGIRNLRRNFVDG